MTYQVGSFLPVIFIPVLLFGLLSSLFWIWMLIDCLTNEPSEGNDKLIWGLVVFLGNLLGAVLYFVFRRPQRIALQDQPVDAKFGLKPEKVQPSRQGSLLPVFIALFAVAAIFVVAVAALGFFGVRKTLLPIEQVVPVESHGFPSHFPPELHGGH